jgi:hypothetical protein
LMAEHFLEGVARLGRRRCIERGRQHIGSRGHLRALFGRCHPDDIGFVERIEEVLPGG